MKNKIIFGAALAIVLAIVGSWYYAFVYSKHNHRNVASEQAIAVTATDLANEYQANEQLANSKYLDKTLQVTGTITDIGKNQDGKTTVALKTSDMMTLVYCTLKDFNNTIHLNQEVVIKGICIGLLSDVKLNDAIIVNKKS